MHHNRISIYFAFLLTVLAGTSFVHAAATCPANLVLSTPSVDFIINGDGTVTHSKTGLMWKQCAEGLSTSTTACDTGSAGGGGATTLLNWADALAAAATPFAGYSDWRLPNIKELQSIVEISCFNPSINEAVFPNTPSNSVSFLFWSNTAYAYNPDAVYLLNFFYGGAYGGVAPKTGTFAHNVHVRLVRSGQSFAGCPAGPGTATINGTTGGNAQATISFTGPTTSGGSPITGYTVTSSPGGITATGTASPITVLGLTNGTAYTFTVTATNSDCPGVASGAGKPVVPTAITTHGHPIYLTAGWNLAGNIDPTLIDVGTLLGDSTKISSVWTWNKAAGKWVFYAPSMAPSALATYAQSMGYDVLSSIASKEGFWVNASTASELTSPQAPSAGPGAAPLTLLESDLQPGWNLMANAYSMTPSQLNAALSSSLNAAGKAIVTVWAWDVASAKWKFYAPSLQAQGGTVLADYISNKGYLPFSTAISAEEGFWLNVGTNGRGPGGGGGAGGSTGTGALTIVKDAQPNDPQDFHFTTVGAGLSDFDLDDDGINANPLSNSITFTNLAAGIPFTVTEDAVSGWTVPSIQCVVALPGLTTTFTDQLNRTFTVNLEAGANVTCTFINVNTRP